VPRQTAPRPLPKSVQIVWDASGSGARRRIDRELALLDAYFAAVRDTSVTLVRVADVAAPPQTFAVRGGDWRALRRSLETTVYDGASNLGAVRHDGVSQEALWFSDGLANYGAPWRLAFPVPVYAINSAASSAPAALQALADATGGRSIDLQTATRQGAVDALLRRGSELVGIDAVGARDVVVESQSVASGRLVAAGILTGDAAEVTVRVRDAAGAVTTRVVAVQARGATSSLAALQWARLTLASLEGEARTNKVRIREIGKRFGWRRARRRSSFSSRSTTTCATTSSRRPSCVPRTTGSRRRSRSAAPTATRSGSRRSCAASRRGSRGGTATSRRATCRRRSRSRRRSRQPRPWPTRSARSRRRRRRSATGAAQRDAQRAQGRACRDATAERRCARGTVAVGAELAAREGADRDGGTATIARAKKASTASGPSRRRSRSR
jgi:hypothetical protein